VPENEYDIVTVGGGLGGSSLAKVIGEKGGDDATKHADARRS